MSIDIAEQLMPLVFQRFFRPGLRFSVFFTVHNDTPLYTIRGASNKNGEKILFSGEIRYKKNLKKR